MRAEDTFPSTFKISKRDEISLKSILEVEIFDLGGIYFWHHFRLFEGKEYVLVTIDYVSMWVEAIPIRAAGHREVLRMLIQHIFS